MGRYFKVCKVSFSNTLLRYTSDIHPQVVVVILLTYLADLGKVVNRPQAEISEFYNVLKIA